MFEKIIIILSVPLMLLNSGAGIVGGIWLAILGEWRLLGIGVVLLFTFHFFLSILMIPGTAIGGIAIVFHKKKNPLRHLFGYLSGLYVNILIASTCIFAFCLCSRYYMASGAKDLTRYIPYLLWSWGMALGPWQYFASKENNEMSAITVFAASILYMLFLVGVLASAYLAFLTIALFILVQFIGLPIFGTYLAMDDAN